MNVIEKDEQYYKNLDVLAKGIYSIVTREKSTGDATVTETGRSTYNTLGYLLDLLFGGELDKFSGLCAAHSVFVASLGKLNLQSEEVLCLKREAAQLTGQADCVFRKV